MKKILIVVDMQNDFIDGAPSFRRSVVLFFRISFNIVKKSVSFFRNSMKKRPFSAVCLDNIQKP